MAEKIVGFKIEIKGQKDILKVTKLMGLLNTQLILVAGTLAEIYNASGTAERQLKQFGTTAQTAGGAISESFKTFDNGNKVVKKLGSEYKEVTKAVKAAGAEEKKAQKTKKKTIVLSDAELRAKEKLKLVNRERAQIAKQTAILTSKESGEIEKLRAKLSLTTIKWKKLTKEELNNTKKGKNLIKTKKDLTNQLKKLEKQTGDNRRNVGNYVSSLGKLGKAAGAIFIGRGIAQGIRKIGGAIKRLVDKNKEGSESAKSLSESFGRVSAILEKLGLFLIDVIAAPLKGFLNGLDFVSSSLFGVSLGAKKASEGVKDLQHEFNAEIETLKRGNLSTEARKKLIEDINRKYKDYLPTLLTIKSTEEEITAAQLAGNKAFEQKILFEASKEQFIDLQKRRSQALAEEAKLERAAFTLQQKKLKLEKESIAAFDKGYTDDGARLGLQAQKAALAFHNAEKALEASKTYTKQLKQEKKALDEVVKAEGFDTSKFKDLTEEQQKAAEEAKKAAIDAAKKEAAAVAKQKEADRKKAEADLKKSLEQNAKGRESLILKLNTQLAQLEVKTIEDKNEKLIAQEQLNFEKRQQLQDKQVNQAIAKNKADLKKNIELNEGEHEKNLLLEHESEEEIKALISANNELKLIQLQQYNDKIEAINKAATDEQAAATETARAAEIAETEAQLEKEDAIEQAADKKRIDKSIEADKKAAEAKAEIRKQTTAAIINAVNVTIQAIADISALAFQAENERFEQAINNRKENITKLNEDLQSATGLQKKFLLQQVQQEEEALKKETDNREKARKKQAETQKAIAITQAIIAAALGIANAFTLPPPASFIAAAATAVATAVQIATIASQKFAKGGILQGPAHSAGGIQTAFGELEGGEAVINRKSTKMFKPILSALNRAGGGKSFADGGILGEVLTAPQGGQISGINTTFQQFLQASQDKTNAINARIDRLQVVQDLNNLQDLQDNDSTLNTLTTL